MSFERGLGSWRVCSFSLLLSETSINSATSEEFTNQLIETSHFEDKYPRQNTSKHNNRVWRLIR